MKTKLAAGVAATVIMITTNCVPTGPNKDYAAIQVVTKVGSYTTTIQEIDGWPVPPKKNLVLLPQGNHKIAFELKKDVPSDSSGNPKVIVATKPVNAEGGFTAGKMHQVNPSHVTLRRVPTEGTPLVNIRTGDKEIYETSGLATIMIAQE